jgi:C_GCAxxG_C_C family probable redox protein
MKPREQIEEETMQYLQAGFCCTEAIIQSITESHSNRPSRAIPRIGTGFCKGIGMTGEDICGIVVGGIIAIGYLCGRDTENEDKSKATQYAAKFRERFIAENKTTNCMKLLEKFGKQTAGQRCRQMTAQAAGMLADILSK